FAVQYALMEAHLGRQVAFHRLVVSQLASWWPLAFLSPPLVAIVLRFRTPGGSRARALLLHSIGAVLFVLVAGACMGLSERLIPWDRQTDGLLAAAKWGILGYLGPDL